MVEFYHDRERQLLVYDTPEPAKITQYVAGAQHLYNGYVAVPITLYNLQLLRWLDLPVIPPMNTGYDWPHGPSIEAPFRAQIITANFLAVHPRAFVLSEMRTGKTLSLLWAADYVMRQHAPGTCRAIIAAPLTILQRVWGDAIYQHFMGRRTYGILHGSAAQRLATLAEPHDFYIINHDGVGVGAHVAHKKRSQLELRGFAAALAGRADIRIAIIDEISAYRNGTTRRHKVARALLQPRSFFWGATGTPTPNGPTDAHGQAKLINDAFGEKFTHYRERVMFRVSQFKWVPARGSHIEARKLLSPSIRFEMKDCADVPPKLPPQLLDVTFSAEQAKAYAALKRDAILAVEGGTISAANEAVLRTKLIQIACGAVYENRGDERIVHELDATPRISATEELIEQAGGKIIILAPLTSVLSMLYKRLTAHRSDVRPNGYSCAIINGDVKSKDRDEILRGFQDDADPEILLADPGTMAHGLDLSVAKVILWYALPEKTEQYLQANERIRGPRQKYPTLVAQLAATPVEREIFRRLETNESLQGVMLALVKGDDNAVYRRPTGAALH